MPFLFNILYRLQNVRGLLLYLPFVLLFAAYTFTLQAKDGNDRYIKQAIYADDVKSHGSTYTKMWGSHYKDVYTTPVTVKSVSLDSLFGGLSFVEQVPRLRGILMKDGRDDLYMIKLLDGASCFIESSFFQNIYDPKEYENTYLGNFIKEAFTIKHPFTFLASDYLAKHAGLNSSNAEVVYVDGGSQCDTIVDGTSIVKRLVGVYSLPDIKDRKIVSEVDSLLTELHNDRLSIIDETKYIRSRLFDILIGDWNKIPENWIWVASARKDSIVYEPIVLDRSHGFTKVNGVLYPQMLSMLGLNFISNYESEQKNLKQFNALGYTLDVALCSGSKEDDWVRQAEYLKRVITDKVIDDAFALLPAETQGEVLDDLKSKLRKRRNSLTTTARKYHRLLQKTPVIVGSNGDDRIVVDTDKKKDLSVRIYDKQSDSLVYDQKFNHKQTKEVWIYGLKGNDRFEVDKKTRRIPVLISGGEGHNEYLVNSHRKLRIYESKEQKERLVSHVDHKDVDITYPNAEETALAYDYKRLRYTQLSFTPIGIYDSDLGLNLGTSVAYTIYGFRRAPYTRRHQLSYDYANGITYQGIFPDYDHKKRFHVSAFVGSPRYFSNFFGFGNETEGHKDKNNNYNRVHISRYTLTPAFYYSLTPEQTFNVYSSFEVMKVDNPDNRNRYINEVYDDDSSIFDAKYFIDLGVKYQMDKRQDRFLSRVQFSVSGGLNMNIGHFGKNYTYVKSDLGVNLELSDRLTLATLMRGQALFTDKFEFFQSATTELRGYRNNRFIGKQSFYQYTDLRYDLGRLSNPFTPLKSGVFVGSDYGRVWCQGEDSRRWHSSYGGGFWLTVFKKFTGKFSYFGSSDGGRFIFELGMGF